MIYSRLLSFRFLSCESIVLCLTVAFLIAACDDPSNVGIGLVDEEEGGLPEVRRVDPTTFENAPPPRISGSAPRILAGLVEDPLVGMIEAEGYFDHSSPASSSFREDEVESASLLLNTTYVYGDTTAPVTFAIRQINEDWESSGLPADTSFSVGSIITEFEFDPTDTLVTIPLPPSWVSENDAVLRSEDFPDEFHGFRLEQVAGNAVVGFAGESQMRAFTETDSAVYPVNRAYAAARRLSDPSISNRTLAQASVGPLVAFELDLEGDVIANTAINQARLVFQTDSVALDDTPLGFHRPIITTLDLYGLIEDGDLVLIDRASLDSEGRFIFEGSGLTNAMQDILLDTRTFDGFELRLPVGQGSFGITTESAVLGSINVQLFYDLTSAENAPSGFFTVTPLD